MLKENTFPPDFRFKISDKKIISLSAYRGKWVLIYFYPKDNTPGCTIEACTIRDNFSEFEKLNAVVIGISADSEKSHEHFVEEHKLPFLLLSDPKRELIRAYGASQTLGIKRISYLIDPKGMIRKVYEKVIPGQHAKEVIKDIRVLSSQDKHKKQT
jgi:peroxiredoxin Q/BCP